MRRHPLLLSTDRHIKEADGHVKEAFPVLATLGTLAAILGTVGGGAFAYNQLRRAWRGPEYDQYINVFPAFGRVMPSTGNQASAGWNFGYAIPGALAGAALGGLLGKNWTSAALGSLAGAGLGYFLGNRSPLNPTH